MGSHRICHFPRLDRKIKSVTEETPFVSRDPFVPRSFPLRPFVRTTIRSSGTLFSFCDLTSSSLADSTRLDFASQPFFFFPGVNTLCPNKKTLNCCAAYYEKSLGANSGICREKLARDCSRDNGGADALCIFVLFFRIFGRIIYTTFSFLVNYSRG